MSSQESFWHQKKHSGAEPGLTLRLAVVEGIILPLPGPAARSSSGTLSPTLPPGPALGTRFPAPGATAALARDGTRTCSGNANGRIIALLVLSCSFLSAQNLSSFSLPGIAVTPVLALGSCLDSSPYRVYLESFCSFKRKKKKNQKKTQQKKHPKKFLIESAVRSLSESDPKKPCVGLMHSSLIDVPSFEELSRLGARQSLSE